MGYLFVAFVFLFGSAIGSFLNVVICRLETGEGIVKKRSHCVRCGQTLNWYELIPIFSFLGLLGRCRSCREKISWQYPLVEIVTGLLFVLTFYLNYELRITNYGYELFAFSMIHDLFFIIQLLFHWVIISCLIVIFVYDLRHYIIPDVVLFPAVGVVFVYRIVEVFFNPSLALPLIRGGKGWGGFGLWQQTISYWPSAIGQFSPYLFSALCASVFFLIIILLTRGKGMGLGDAKLAFLMGLLLGWPNILVALFIAFFVGATVGVGLIFWKKKTMKSQIPFGPFLIGGTLVMLFWGQFFLDWYGSLYL